MPQSLMVVILNMDLKEVTIALIDSLLQAGFTVEQLILVDNGSKDGSPEEIRAKFGPQIHIISNSENHGFAQANNQGFENAVRRDADWVLLLNNDTLVPEDFFKKVEGIIAAEPPFQIITPVIYYYSDPERIWHMGSKRIPGTLLGWNLSKNQKLKPHLPPFIDVDFISGCAMLIQSKVYVDIGLFDPVFFAYWEEVDFCTRARRAGYRLAVASELSMVHKISLTANKHPSKLKPLYMRNMILYYRKNAHLAQWLVMFPYLVYRFLRQMVADSFHPGVSPASYIKAWKDGWNLKI